MKKMVIINHLETVQKTILPYWLVTKCSAILFYLFLVVRTDDFII